MLGLMYPTTQLSKKAVPEQNEHGNYENEITWDNYLLQIKNAPGTAKNYSIKTIFLEAVCVGVCNL